MPRFRYWTNLPFVIGCCAYAINRWGVKPLGGPRFCYTHFDDLWLIPCALPPLLWLHRRLGLRTHDEPPRWSEILAHLAFWCLFLEWMGPQIVPHSVGDPWDAAAYAAGALPAGLWWQRQRWMRSFQPS